MEKETKIKKEVRAIAIAFCCIIGITAWQGRYRLFYSADSYMELAYISICISAHIHADIQFVAIVSIASIKVAMTRACHILCMQVNNLR